LIHCDNGLRVLKVLRDVERESLGCVLKNGLARNEPFPLLLPSSNAVAVNCDFQTLFSLSGLSVVKI